MSERLVKLVNMSEVEEFELQRALKASLKVQNSGSYLLETLSGYVADTYIERGYFPVRDPERRRNGEMERLTGKGGKYVNAVWQGTKSAKIDARTIRQVRDVPKSSRGHVTDALFAGIGQYRHSELSDELIDAVDGHLLVARMITLGLEYQRETSGKEGVGVNVEVREKLAELDEAYLTRKLELHDSGRLEGEYVRENIFLEAREKDYTNLLELMPDLPPVTAGQVGMVLVASA